MRIFESVQHFIDSLDNRNFKIYAGGFLAVIAGLCALIFLWRYFALSSTRETLESVNESREKAQRILNTYRQVKSERDHLDTILNKDPDFNLAEYLKTVLDQLNITLLSEQDVEITNVSRDNLYDERNVTATLIDLDMKTLTELLEILERNERITVKKVDINRAEGNTIKVTITIATLIKKT